MVMSRTLEPRLAAAAAASFPAWPAPTTITSYSGSILNQFGGEDFDFMVL
jgi:hypothetical protein